MNATSHMQSKWRPTVDEPQKNEIQLFYLHFDFTSVLSIICEIFI